ncbi:winged helix-turn-helix domain-containing protein [Jiangella gansuensis]|uniref:winged helix-turn-helix domain-containing protein n=1 Tax=Jiangella gansuensis TaxID=281473 RepID=UPI0006843025|nr:winged helix-turn-helix domain-containing protein [Jiangella gansuensis]
MASHPGRAQTDRAATGPPSVAAAGVTLDLASREAVLPDGRQVVLTPLEAAVLAHLLKRPGRVCSRDELMCQALGYPVPIGSRTVDVHIASLRGKLGDVVRLRSVRGVGYTLEPVTTT